MIHVNVVVDKAVRKMEFLENKLHEEGKLSVKEIAELGKNFARQIAPRDSGMLVSLIQVQKGRGDHEAIVVSKNPRSNRLWPNRGTYGSNFNLVRWMHETGGRFRSPNPFGFPGKKHIRTGEPRYMYKTRDYLKSQGVGRVTARFNKVVASVNNT